MDKIVNVPDITYQISTYLTPKELSIACQVCQSWFSSFANQLWRSFRSDKRPHQAMVEALPRYSTFIRELNCSIFFPLDKLGPECTRLTYFKAPILYVDNTDVILSIMKRNLEIEELWLRSSIPWERMNISMEIVRVISKMSRLRKLTLVEFKLIPETLEWLLRQFPQLRWLHVESYEVREVPGFDTHSSLISTSTETDTLHDHSLSHPPSLGGLYRLRSLHMDGFQYSFKSIMSIASMSPKLERISLSEVRTNPIDLRLSDELVGFCQELGNCCPQLAELKLSQVKIDKNGLACLLTAFPKLRSFDVENIQPSDVEILHMFLHHPSYRNTLEEFRIDSYLRLVHSATDVDLIHFLQGYRKLKKVSLRKQNIKVDNLINDFIVSRQHSSPKIGEDDLNDGRKRKKEEEGDIHDKMGTYLLKCRDLRVLDITFSSYNWNNVLPTDVLENIFGAEHHKYRKYNLTNIIRKLLHDMPVLDVSTIKFK